MMRFCKVFRVAELAISKRVATGHSYPPRAATLVAIRATANARMSLSDVVDAMAFEMRRLEAVADR
jgi:hypothetical protein